MKKSILFVTFLLVSAFAYNAMAQQFSMPSQSFSQTKTSYITKNDDSVTEAKILILKYKKGQIAEMKVKDETGNKIKIKPTDIKMMYLPQSMLDKIGQADKFLTDAKLWKSDNLDNSKIADGYVYFESTDVKFGKKIQKLLMQVVNPAFCSKVKIYNDPFASETMGVGVGGITLAGGDLKSYYFKKGDEPAVLLQKKDYKKKFAEIWSDCPALIEKYGEKPVWNDLAQHVYEYSTICNQ
ncbi:MAG: hypothetical protein KA807_15220 [Prolixibacteraceae bacterium]|nr:hypothetical protein [Prolixibacteraceae bacterium]